MLHMRIMSLSYISILLAIMILARTVIGADQVELCRIPESEERELIREYIQESRRVTNNNSPTTEEDINVMFALTKAYKMVLH